MLLHLDKDPLSDRVRLIFFEGHDYAILTFGDDEVEKNCLEDLPAFLRAKADQLELSINELIATKYGHELIDEFCTVAHFGPDGKPTPSCQWCKKCRSWVTHKDIKGKCLPEEESE